MKKNLLLILVLFSCSTTNNSEELNDKAFTELESGNFNEAIELYSKVIEQNPEDMIALNNRSHAYWNLGELDKALKDVNKALSIEFDYDALANRATYNLYANNYSDAISDFDQVIPKDSSAQNFNNRGLAYYFSGNSKKAIENYKVALSIDSTYSESYNNLSLIYVNETKFEEAVSLCDIAIRFDSTNVYGFSNRGWANNFLGNYETAIEDFNNAIRIDSTFYAAYANRAISNFRLSNIELACLDYQKAQKLGLDEPLEELTGNCQ
jgi:tetratricopeptide (TPR) repeat protein